MWSLQSFTWVSWEYLSSKGILCKPQLHHFLPFFVAIHSQNKTYCLYFSLLISYFVCLFLFLFSTPPCRSLSSVSLCMSSTFSLTFCLFLCLFSPFFLACLLSFPSDFLCLSSSFFFSFSLFVCLLLSFLAVFWCISLLFFYQICLTLLFLFSCVFDFIFLYFCSVFFTIQFLVCFFLLFFYLFLSLLFSFVFLYSP